MSEQEKSHPNPTEVIADFLRRVPQGMEHAIDVVHEMTGENSDRPQTTLVMRNRKLQDEPRAEAELGRSLARNHVFHSARGFIEYIIREGEVDKISLFADVAGGEICCVLDETLKVGGVEVVTLKPMVHPLFAPWAEVLSRSDDCAMPIKAFCQFLLLHRRQVVEPDAMELMATLRQVRGSKSIEVMQGRGSGAVNGVMVETTIQGNAAKEPVDLPDSLVVLSPLYVGLQAVKVAIDLLVDMPGQGVVVSLCSSDLQRLRVEAFEEMVEQCREELGDAAVVSLGEFSLRGWLTVS